MLKGHVFKHKKSVITLVNRWSYHRRWVRAGFQMKSCSKGGLRKDGSILWLIKSRLGGGSLMGSPINWPGIWPDIVWKMPHIVSACPKNHLTITFYKSALPKSTDLTSKVTNMKTLESLDSLLRRWRTKARIEVEVSLMINWGTIRMMINQILFRIKKLSHKTLKNTP